MFVYCFAGFCAGIGALAITCMVGGGDPLIGSTVVMTAISAAVIGGVSLSGGRGDIAGGIFGCLFLGLLTNIVVSMRLDVFSQGLLTAVILLLGILVAVAVGTKRVTKGALKRGSKYDTK
jgi:ribose transport system permease protein